MSLTADIRSSYAVIIDSILAKSDLGTVSAKQIRKGLQESIGQDLTLQKDDINALIFERFDQAANRGSTKSASEGNSNHVNTVSGTVTLTGHKKKRENDSDESSISVDDAPPPRQRSKLAAAEDDAAFAARLQAEEDARARTTRGTASSKRNNAKKLVKKSKSVAKVKVTDDSDLESEEGSEKPVKRSGAFHKPFTLSQPLAELLGEKSLSRPQTVKKIWEYVKANNLQNQNDKRQIICDDAMRAVFKSDTVHMFTMNKILSKHLYDEGDCF